MLGMQSNEHVFLITAVRCKGIDLKFSLFINTHLTQLTDLTQLTALF